MPLSKDAIAARRRENYLRIKADPEQWAIYLEKARTRNRACFALHQEQMNARRRAVYAENRDVILKRNAAWRSSNPERIGAYNRAYYAKNRARLMKNERNRQQQHEVKERRRLRKMASPEIAARSDARQILKRTIGGDPSEQLVEIKAVQLLVRRAIKQALDTSPRP